MYQVSEESSGISRFVAWVLVGVALVVVWLVFFGRHEAKEATTPRVSSVAATAAPEAGRRAALPRRPIAAGPRPVRSAGPFIERVDVEKSEACYGEENFATVRAFDASGATDRLIVRMGDSREMGFRMPFRINRFDVGRTRRVFVQGPGGSVGADIPEVKMRDCEVAERVTIEVSLEDRSPHVFELSAEVENAAAGSAGKFEPVSYEWDFGDGTRQKTDGPKVVHSYEGKPVKTRYSYYLIRVQVSDRRGKVVEGSRAYGFPNFGFGAFVDDHQILVHSAGGSMPGKRGTEERVRLYHGFEGVVRLERVRSSELDRSTKRVIATEEGSPAALLGVSELSPGTSTPTRDLSALRPTAPNRVRKLELVGHAGAIEARGRILLTSTAQPEGDTPQADDVPNAPSAASPLGG